jgi:hypothetical protein
MLIEPIRKDLFTKLCIYVVGAMERTVAMRTAYLASIATVALGAIVGSAVYSIGTADYCPQPSPSSVATLFAPCQAFDAAMGRSITKKEAAQMGLLKTDGRPAVAPARQPEPTPAQLVAEDFQIIAQERATVGVAH